MHKIFNPRQKVYNETRCLLAMHKIFFNPGQTYIYNQTRCLLAIHKIFFVNGLTLFSQWQNAQWSCISSWRVGIPLSPKRGVQPTTKMTNDLVTDRSVIQVMGLHTRGAFTPGNTTYTDFTGTPGLQVRREWSPNQSILPLAALMALLLHCPVDDFMQSLHHGSMTWRNSPQLTI